jgi:hypothetical protein
LIYLVVIGLSFQQQDHFYGTSKFDAASYVSHAFTIGLDGDLDYRNELAFSYRTSLNPAETAPRHPMGMGILAAPFVAAFSLIDRANDHPVLADRTAYIGSWSYFGIQFATAFYFLAGIALYQLALGRWVNSFIVAAAVISAGLLYYVTGQFAFVHAYEFFTLAALTAACVELCRARKGWQTGALVSAIGAATFLAFMVRWADYGTLAVPLLAIVTHYLIERDGRYRRAIALSYAGVLGGLAAVSLFHLWAFGIIWPTPEYFYGTADIARLSANGGLMARFLRNLPNLPLLLFSSEFGLLWTFPLFPIACAAGLFATWRWLREEPLPWALWALAIGWCVAVPLAIVLLWETTASGYGYRYLLPSMPALMLIMAVFLRSEAVDRHYGHNGEWASMVVGVVLVPAAFLGLVSFLAQVGFLKLPGFTARPQLNVFGVEHHASARGYMDAVFGAIARPSQWLEIYQQSLFVRVMTPSVEMRAMPQLVDQFRVLLLVIPLIGAMSSAAAVVRDWRRFAMSAARVLFAAALLWPLALRAIDAHERPLDLVAFGTRSAEPFVGNGFRREAPGYHLSWIVERPATIHGVLPQTPGVKISAHFYNPHPNQTITVLLNGREIGKWDADIGHFQPSLTTRLQPSEAGQIGTIQFMVNQIEPFEGSENAALGVMMYSVTVEPE